MLPGLCWLRRILSCARGMSLQANTSDMQGSTLRVSTMSFAALACLRLAKWLPCTLLAHPQEAGVQGQVVAGSAGADHHHAAALDHEHRDRKGRLARCSNTMSTSLPLPVISQIALPNSRTFFM